jgi:CubicO group peptidase (beta-lactamase class C family)
MRRSSFFARWLSTVTLALLAGGAFAAPAPAAIPAATPSGAAPAAPAAAPGPRLAALEAEATALLQRSFIGAARVAIVDSTGVRFAKAFGRQRGEGGAPVDERTLMRVGSVSKSITALAVARLVEQGRLRWDTKLADIAPEVVFDNPWEATQPLRVVHLVEHTTGWDDVPYADYAFDEPNHAVADYARRPLATASDRRSHWPPGRYFRYANGGPAVAGFVIEKASGLPFDAAVKALVFDPLGMHDAAFTTTPERMARTTSSYTGAGAADERWWHMPIRPSGSLVTSLADMTAWLGFWVRGGTAPDGTRLVSPEAFRRLLHAEGSVAAAAGVGATYSKGLFHYLAGGRLWYGHWGKVDGFRAAWGFLPAHRVGFVVDVNALDGAARSKLLNLAAEAAAEGLPPDAVKPSDAAAVAALAPAEGWYIDRSPDRELASLPLAVARPSYVWIDAAAARVKVGGSPGDPAATSYRVPAAAKPGLLELEAIGEPTAALVQVDGTWEYLAGSRHVRVPAWQVWGVRGVLAAAAIVLVLGLLWLPVWAWSALRARLSWRGVALRALPLFSAASAAAVIAAIVPGLLLASASGAFQRFGQPSAWSLAVLALSIVMPLAAALAVWLGWRSAGEGRLARGFAIAGGLVLIALAVVFAQHGWIGVRTWRD